MKLLPETALALPLLVAACASSPDVPEVAEPPADYTETIAGSEVTLRTGQPKFMSM